MIVFARWAAFDSIKSSKSLPIRSVVDKPMTSQNRLFTVEQSAVECQLRDGRVKVIECLAPGVPYETIPGAVRVLGLSALLLSRLFHI